MQMPIPKSLMKVRYIFKVGYLFCSLTHISVAMRIEWLRTRARARRWAEEVALLTEEMRRTLRYTEWKAAWWREQKSLREEIRQDYRSGLDAYAEKQAKVWESLGIYFAGMWRTLHEAACIPMRWSPQHLSAPYVRTRRKFNIVTLSTQAVTSIADIAIPPPTSTIPPTTVTVTPPEIPASATASFTDPSTASIQQPNVARNSVVDEDSDDSDFGDSDEDGIADDADFEG